MEVFPIYLRKLDQRKTVIIGGGPEAEGKVKQLLERNALLTVISATLTPQLKLWAQEERFQWVERNYRRGDLEGAFMAIVAEFEDDVNEKVYHEAVERDILINVMDDIKHANFAFGSIVKQGPLTISISTSGTAPALAVRLRQRFEPEFGPEYALFLEFMQKLRGPMARHHPDSQMRKELWYRLIDSKILYFFNVKQFQNACHLASKIVGRQVVEDAFEQELQPQ